MRPSTSSGHSTTIPLLSAPLVAIPCARCSATWVWCSREAAFTRTTAAPRNHRNRRLKVARRRMGRLTRVQLPPRRRLRLRTAPKSRAAPMVPPPQPAHPRRRTEDRRRTRLIADRASATTDFIDFPRTVGVSAVHCRHGPHGPRSIVGPACQTGRFGPSRKSRRDPTGTNFRSAAAAYR